MCVLFGTYMLRGFIWDDGELNGWEEYIASILLYSLIFVNDISDMQKIIV